MCLFPFELMQFRFQRQVLAGGRTLSMKASAGLRCRMMLAPLGGDNADRHHIDPVWQADIAHPLDLGPVHPMGNGRCPEIARKATRIA
jgi:hypothetical protein